MVASATAGYLASHLNPGTILAGHPSAALVQQSLVHGYTVGFWWTAGIYAGRRRGVRDAAAAGAAAPPTGTRRHGRGTKGCAARTSVRSLKDHLSGDGFAGGMPPTPGKWVIGRSRSRPAAGLGLGGAVMTLLGNPATGHPSPAAGSE